MKKIVVTVAIFFGMNASYASSEYFSISENMKSLDWAVANNNFRKACYHIGHLSTVLYSVKFNLIKTDSFDQLDKNIIESPKFLNYYVSLVPVSIYCDPTNTSSEPKFEKLKDSYKIFNNKYQAMIAGGSGH